MTTTINIIGTIATDPRLITPASGTPLCSFRVASDERRYDREQQSWVEGPTNWFGIVCFRTLATHAHKSFNKGDRIIATGKLRIRNWEKDDRHGTSVEIEAEAIGHDLRWGVSSFEKKSVAQSNKADAQPAVNDASGKEKPNADAPADTAPSQLVMTSGGEPSSDGFTPEVAAA